MKRITLYAALSIMLSASCHAQKQADVSRLDSIYEALSLHQGASATEVEYTGGGNSECRSFTWQRGWGTGWTKGTRIDIKDMGREESEHIRQIFLSFKNILGHVLVTPNIVATYEEGSSTFYGYATDDDGKAHFMRAATEGEICVPADWTTRNYFKGSMPKAEDLADDKTKRILGLSRLWAGVRQNFVFMNTAPVDWDSLYVEMIPRMEAALDNKEAVRLLKYMVARLQDGHTYIFGRGGTPLPLTTRLIDGKVYVDQILSSELLERNIQRGIELTDIDGKPVTVYAKEEIEPYTASSTPQWLRHCVYEDFGLTRRDYGDSIALNFKNGKRSISLKCKIGELKWDLQKEESVIRFARQRNSIGYLRIANFANPQLRDEFDKCYPDLLQTSALIIDIRGNGGGHSSHADYILRHLSADTIKTAPWKSPQYIPAFKSWGREDSWYESPSQNMPPIQDKPIYDKPIVVLVDNGTFSAAEDFCAVFLGMRRGILIGQPTGGSTGSGVRIPLIPSTNIWANICSKHDTAPDGTEFVGKGFIPEITVEEDYKSYFTDKQDKGIATAIKVLSH
ncbi:MAG: S41 family peptidase [Bacteroides sp.]|nr:S41 family peptidase [Roseburia sp.]MCM1346185.1 S41 family peptidase [Bacteroides sp.]MCM1420678.1 S41 family peptidase [Bacteroides sp.]